MVFCAFFLTLLFRSDKVSLKGKNKLKLMKKKLFSLSLFALLSLASCVNPNVTPSTPEPTTPTPSTPPSTTPPSTSNPESSSPETSAPAPLPANTLPQSYNNIINSSLSTTSVLRLYEAPNGATINEQQSRVDYDPTNLRSEITDVDGLTEYKLFRRVGDDAHTVYVDANDYKDSNGLGKFKVEPSGQTWASLSWITDSFDYNEFRNDAATDPVYYYYSTKPAAEGVNRIVTSLTQMDLTELFTPGIASLSLRTNNGRIESLEAQSNEFTVDNRPVKYELIINLENSVRPIQNPQVPVDFSSQASSVYGRFYEVQQSTKTSYTATTTNTLTGGNVIQRTTVNPEVVYIEKETRNGNNSTYERSGYFNAGYPSGADNKGFVHFTVQPDNSVIFDQGAPNKDLNGAAMLGQNAEAANFLRDSADLNSLVPLPYLKNSGNAIPFKLSAANEVLDYSVRFNIDRTAGTTSNGLINQITYDVVSNGVAGKETISIDYAARNAVKDIPTTVIQALRTSSSQTHFSWQDEPLVYQGLTTFYKSPARALGIPFLYDSNIYKKWTTSDNGTSTQLVAQINATVNGYTPQQYHQDYTNLLKAKGYAFESSNGQDDIYRLDEVRIAVRKTGTFRVVFTLAV